MCQRCACLVRRVRLLYRRRFEAFAIWHHGCGQLSELMEDSLLR